MSADPLTEKKTRRFRFLNALYDKTDGNEEDVVDMWELGTLAGLGREDTERVVQYLVGEHLVQYVAMGGAIGITHFGVVQVEKALSEPERPTEYFPPVINLVQIGSMSGSNIQQGGSGSSLEATVLGYEPAALGALVKGLKEALPVLSESVDVVSELRAHITTLEAQAALKTPNRPIVHEALKTIRRVLEEMTGNVLASGLLEQIQVLLR